MHVAGAVRRSPAEAKSVLDQLREQQAAISIAKDAFIEGRRADAVAVLLSHGVDDAEAVVDHLDSYVIVEGRPSER